MSCGATLEVDVREHTAAVHCTGCFHNCCEMLVLPAQTWCEQGSLVGCKLFEIQREESREPTLDTSLETQMGDSECGQGKFYAMKPRDL